MFHAYNSCNRGTTLLSACVFQNFRLFLVQKQH